MRDETRRNLRVGLLVLAALAALAVGVFTIGERQQLFVLHTRYYTTFRDVLGLQPGAPVDLEGVTVGFVDRIELPTNIEERRISVWFSVDARYTARIRKDTVASIKTVGLLGDRYLKLTGGTPSSPRVLEGGLVRGLDPPELEHLVAGGADLMENLLAISSSLKVILKRVEAGEGVLGQITMGPTEGKPIGTTLTASAASLQRILSRIEQGHGVVGRMVADDGLAQRLFDDLTAATGAAREVTTGLAQDMAAHDSAYAVLLRDPKTAGQLRESLAAIHQASQALAAASEELATGQGTLPRLLRDRKFAGDFLGDLEGLTKNLRSVADKLNSGDGTAGAFINDPQMYKDMENVVRGVKSSKIVSWFIRNRRRKGEKIAAQEAAHAAAQAQ
ncbi:MAG: MlaD family protein [Acidobacteria bacterium]|nr:MlaD family protein [Acidobacteriota bacterium]